ncbi:hypothetical protein K431DRAFT_285567 [Polychaeton citri CBS 116435]|uniref:phosphoinositide 5-phosphatase n=1 Tax=Polychaeton citri CBS 116435 TaxID=1314669 RepID=A0A9P4Q7F4_9PEZI|nr:hypothetical protein K431DRAFT_285567 [Polychaeton citri CBS 116435]
MGIRVYLRDHPRRAIALVTATHVLVFRHNPGPSGGKNSSSLSVNEVGAPKCAVEFASWENADMQDYRPMTPRDVHGTLGLITVANDVFLCVVNHSTRAATVRPGETIQRILSVEFHCLNRGDHDRMLYDQNPFPGDALDPDSYDQAHHAPQPGMEHPCMALKKLLSGGSFYYSADFDLTKRLQDRPTEGITVAIDSLDAGFLWNAYMIQPLVNFRSRLSEGEKTALDQSGILTSAIRGFANTVTVPASSSPARRTSSGFPSNMTLISRLSCKRAGTRFNARGIDDDGNVANFVETETIYCTDELCFSYVQCRGSVPLFWEQASGLPGQQKVTVTRSFDATQPAFDKHFDGLVQTYGDVFVVNLLSLEKQQELQLTRLYKDHIHNSALNQSTEKKELQDSEHRHIQMANYDFHAETRGPSGYEAASGIRRYIMDSAVSFEFYLSELTEEKPRVRGDGHRASIVGQSDVLKQAGIFRTNCLDCLDRTNLVQTIISQIAVELFLGQQGEQYATSDFWARHGTLWADCGDALSKIYAGTGALKSSFTRHGKMSLAGAIADVRKSAQRLYINNFEDKARQSIMDMLLGRLIGQVPVHLYDPINDYVAAELHKRAMEYTSSRDIHIWVGTFNLNGKTEGRYQDLSPWLCPDVEKSLQLPEIAAVAFQEIVELSPQQIMSTDPHRRQQWEDAVRETLNTRAKRLGADDYVLLRGGQLVGASLSIFVRTSVLPLIKNVEGAVKKTGMSGMAGNKGAVAIRMECADTSICLVTAHLAAGFANYEERNQDYRTITHGLRFQRNRSIEDHKTVIWFGDFNYRIGISNERARGLIDKGDLSTLYENDQLNLQMVHGRAFHHYSEKTPTFLPTYKYDVGTDTYDTSEKSRIPAWCDRVVTRGDNLRQIYYEASPLKFSDHRPVWALFQATVSVTDQVKKEHIGNHLYYRRREAVGDHTASSLIGESDDESLIGHEPIETGLPPASSDKRKWWLDNGMPAKSTARPPSSNHTPNPDRPSNPFKPTSEPDWIKVEKPKASAPLPPPSRHSSVKTNTSISSSPSIRRKLAPPPDGQPAPAKPPRPAVSNEAIPRTTSSPSGSQKKPGPPRPPKKPEILRSGSTDSTPSSSKAVSTAPHPSGPPPPPDSRRRVNIPESPIIASSSRRLPRTAGKEPGGRGSPAPLPPPPRTTAKTAVDAAGPPLPPRKQTGLGDLMDDDEHEAGGAMSWQPLKPS